MRCDFEPNITSNPVYTYPASIRVISNSIGLFHSISLRFQIDLLTFQVSPSMRIFSPRKIHNRQNSLSFSTSCGRMC